MHLFGLIFFGMIALFWIGYGLRVALRAMRLPWLKDHAPAAEADCPAVSLLFAARDEEEKLGQALEALRAIDYPELEIVAANDRSSLESKALFRDRRRLRVTTGRASAKWSGWKLCHQK